jgi:hypothetical protein
MTSSERPLKTFATWLAFVVATTLALPQPPRLSYVLAGAVLGAVLIVVGFLAASRSRPAMAVRPAAERVRLAGGALLVGAVLGTILLATLVWLARFEPELRVRFAGRIGEPAWRPWALAFESSILEETVFRLFALSVLAWIAGRVVGRGAAFYVGLLGSTILFGLAHLPAWSTAAHAGVLLFSLVVLLNGVGGIAFGVIFWRWGLPYAMYCHFAGDVVIQTLAPRVFG